MPPTRLLSGVSPERRGSGARSSQSIYFFEETDYKTQAASGAPVAAAAGGIVDSFASEDRKERCRRALETLVPETAAAVGGTSASPAARLSQLAPAYSPRADGCTAGRQSSPCRNDEPRTGSRAATQTCGGPTAQGGVVFAASSLRAAPAGGGKGREKGAGAHRRMGRRRLRIAQCQSAGRRRGRRTIRRRQPVEHRRRK